MKSAGAGGGGGGGWIAVFNFPSGKCNFSQC